MFQISLAGRLGRDAEYKQSVSNSELCSFSVACDVGFGDRKQTYWVDVTRWGKGAQGLSGFLKKGSAVAVTGELSTREHNGKTYLQCRADNVTILNAAGESGGSQVGGQSNNAPAHDDLDDDIPY